MSRAVKLVNEKPSSPACLRQIRVLASLPDVVLEQIFPKISVRSVDARGSYLAEPDAIGFVWSGRFRKVAEAASAGGPYSETLDRGSSFGLMRALLRPPNLQIALIAEQPGLLLHAPADHILSIAREHADLSHALMVDLATQSLTFASRTFEVTELDVRTRLQAALLRMTQHGEWNGAGCIIRGAPTHAAIAEQVGAAREAVTRHLRAMSGEGLLTFKRGVIDIKNVEKLGSSRKPAALQYLRYLLGYIRP